jgi:hypothetical protein
MVRQGRRLGIWDLLWAPAVVVACVAAIVTLRVSAPYLPFIIIAGFAATVVEVGWWLAQARRDRRASGSSHADVP